MPKDDYAREYWRIEQFAGQYGWKTVRFNTAILKRAKASGPEKLQRFIHALNVKGLRALANQAENIFNEKFVSVGYADGTIIEASLVPKPAVPNKKKQTKVNADFNAIENKVIAKYLDPESNAGLIDLTKHKKKTLKLQPKAQLKKPEATHVKPERRLALDKDI